jgi:hypothetical protein
LICLTQREPAGESIDCTRRVADLQLHHAQPLRLFLDPAPERSGGVVFEFRLVEDSAEVLLSIGEDPHQLVERVVDDVQDNIVELCAGNEDVLKPAKRKEKK